MCGSKVNQLKQMWDISQRAGHPAVVSGLDPANKSRSHLEDNPIAGIKHLATDFQLIAYILYQLVISQSTVSPIMGPKRRSNSLILLNKNEY